MRTLFAAVAALSLFATSVTFAAPLAPGKPAGLAKAQDNDNTTLLIIGVGVVAAGVVLLASGSGSGNLSSGTIVTTTPKTTPTST